MRRGRAVLVVLAGGFVGVAALVGFSGTTNATSSAPPPTTASLAGTSPQPVAETPRVRAVESVLPPGSKVRDVRLVQSGGADYELLDVDGPAGTYEVTIYNNFARAELEGSGLKESVVPGGVVWLGEDATAASIYFQSSAGNGLRIAHRVAAGPAASIPILQDVAQRLAPLVAP